MRASPADARAEAAAAGGPLIGPGEPPAFRLANPDGRGRAILLADHAGSLIPARLCRLGLGDVPLGRHIAYDIGIGWLAERMAALLDAPAFIHQYSRLVIDPNRSLDDPTSICAISDGVVVPGNGSLGPADRKARAEAFHRPYHDAIDQRVAGALAAGRIPAMVSLHSFTPAMRGHDRPWHVGVLWDGIDGRIAAPLMARLAAEPGLVVGDNEPYSGRNLHGHTVEVHAIARGLPNVLIEVRQDLITQRTDAQSWAGRLAGMLEPILADDGIFRLARRP